MKVLIYQNNIGDITQWGANDLSINFINKICIPSVEKYAKKLGYDYRLYTEHISPRFGKNFLLSEGTYISCNKYFYSDCEDYDNYDQIAYIDNDIYIFDNAERLPFVNGLGAVSEPNESECHEKFSNKFSFKPNIKYISSGVLIFNREIGKKIKKYFSMRFKEQRKGKWKNTDNGIFNECVYIDKEFKIDLLNKKWNYMPHLCETIDNTKPNFLHFIGSKGKDYIKDLYNQTSDVKNFLEKLYW
tara:strand:- start:1334 stop:2065 length:732 start_codon:yes stop_codon:yes gene_type:complete